MFQPILFMALSRDQNAGRSYNIRIDNSSFESVEGFRYLGTTLLAYLLHGAESFLRSQPVNFAASQEMPRIYGTRKFLTVPTSARHLSLS
jgi:hypothetical protein